MRFTGTQEACAHIAIINFLLRRKSLLNVGAILACDIGDRDIYEKDVRMESP